MEQVAQVFFNVPLSKLEPIFKRWIKEAQAETPPQTVEPADQPEQLLTIQEAAEFLSLTVPTMYSKVSKGELPVMKRSKRLYFSRTELLEYLKDGRKKSNAEIDVGAAMGQGGDVIRRLLQHAGNGFIRLRVFLDDLKANGLTCHGGVGGDLGWDIHVSSCCLQIRVYHRKDERIVNVRPGRGVSCGNACRPHKVRSIVILPSFRRFLPDGCQ